MKKLFVLSGVALALAWGGARQGVAGTLAGWDVSTLTASANGFGPSPFAPTSSDPNLTVAGLTRGAGVLTNASAANRAWGGITWTNNSESAAIAANRYATFAVTAKPGYAVSITNISKFSYRRSGTGPASGAIQYQIGGGVFTDVQALSYTNTASTGGDIVVPINLSGISALQNIPPGTNVTFRIVNWGGTSASGTWYLFDTAISAATDFEIQGTTTSYAPTPTQVRVETKADGTGLLVSAQTNFPGSTLTAYAICRDVGGNFVTNDAAIWSLIAKNGGIADGDLVPAADNKSATFTAHAEGAAVIHAVTGSLTSVDSGVLTITAAPTLPTATASASAIIVTNGQTVTLTVTVTPGANPASTGLAVTANLSSIGGSPTQAFSTSDNSVFTYVATVNAAVPATNSIPVLITDGQNRTNTAALTLAVRQAPGPFAIYHVNDTHARLTPHWFVIPQHGTTNTDFELVGGAACMAGEILGLRTGNTNSLFLDAGDISEGNPIGDMNGNGSMVQFYNLLDAKLKAATGRGIDASVVGNHDVRDISYITNLMNATYPVISMNICSNGTLNPFFKPYVIVTVNGTKIGILGYTTGAAEVGASLAATISVVACDWTSSDATKIHVADYVKQLRQTNGCDVVVLLAHTGQSSICVSSSTTTPILVDDGTAKLPEVVVSGHWHTWAETAWQPSILNYKTIFTESASYMKYVGELNVDGAGSYLSAVQHVVRNADITPDADVAAYVANLKTQYNTNAVSAGQPQLDDVIGYSAVPLFLDNMMKWWSPDEYPWTGDNTAGEWICDAMQWHAQQVFNTNCDLALEAGGGVRADVPAGPVTYTQIYETFPWNDDLLTLVKMTGQEIWNFVSLNNCDASLSQGWLVTAHDGVPVSMTYNGQPLDLKKTYNVAINNYMYAHPTTGFTYSDPNPNVASNVLCRTSIVAYTAQFTTNSPMQVPGPRYQLDTEFSGGYRAVVTMMNDNDTSPSYEDAFIRLLSATPETLTRRGSKQVPADLVNADGSINSSNRLAEAELYRSFFGFKRGVLTNGSIIEVWGKNSAYKGNPEFVDQEGIYSNGVEFKIVGSDTSLAQPAYIPAISNFWDSAHKNHYVKFNAKKVGANTVSDPNGKVIAIYDVTAFTAKALPGSNGDILELTGVPTSENNSLRFRCDSAVVSAANGATNFPPTSQIAAVPTLQTSPILTLTATATVATAGSTSNLLALADTQVVSGKPTTTDGTATSLYVQSANTGAYLNERTWVKFDLSNLPAGSSISGARLRMFCWKTPTVGDPMPLSVFGVTDDTWIRTNLTWNTQPFFDTNSPLDTVTIPNNGTSTFFTWDVSSLVQSNWTSDKLVSLCLKADTEGSSQGQSYAFESSRWQTNTFGPFLDVDVVNTNQPITIAQVQFYYRFSTDNMSWSAWTAFETNNAAPWTAYFTYTNGSGYYQFSSAATDSTGAVEPAHVAADTSVYYDLAPVVAFVDPTYGAVGAKNQAITLTAWAAAGDHGFGSVTNVGFFVDGTLLTNVTKGTNVAVNHFPFSRSGISMAVTSYTATWMASTMGRHQLSVEATDTLGVSSGDGVSVSIYALPAPTLTGPANGTVVSNGFPTLSWSAVTSASGYTVALTLPNGNTNISLSGTNLPLSFPLVNGAYTWTVTATNSDGAGAVSSTGNFTLARIISTAPWKFGVISDSQWTVADDGKNPNTIAANIIKQVDSQLISAGVKLVVAVGDMADDASDVTAHNNNYVRALYAQDLYNAGIGFYPTRGNHEAANGTYTGGSADFRHAYPQIVPGLLAGMNNDIPGDITTALISPSGDLANNPPAAATGSPFPVGVNFSAPTGANLMNDSVSYSFDYNNVTFMLLDQFQSPDYYSSHISEQLPWISSTLASRPTNTHAFVITHKNMLGGNHKDNMFGGQINSSDAGDCTGVNYASLPSASQAALTAKTNLINSFIGTMQSNNVKYVVSGHDHHHYNSIVTSPDQASQVHQLICASDSSKFYTPGSPVSTNDLPVEQQLNRIGYYIFTVDGSRVTIDYYADVTANNYSGPFNFVKQSSVGYSLNGQEFVVAEGAAYPTVSDNTSQAVANGESGYLGTTLQFLCGTNASKAANNYGKAQSKAVNTGWAPAGNGPASAASDVLSLWGTKDLGAKAGDKLALSLSYTAPGFTLDQLRSGAFCLASKDAFGHWVNAVDLNAGGARKFIFGPYNAVYGLGTYGVDTASGTVWAVVNHPGDFAAAALSEIVNFIYTSDNHYGITRAFFQGGTNVTGQMVNEAMVAKMNTLPGLTFPNDGGVGAGQPVGHIDFLMDTGDIANRTESQSAVAAINNLNYLGNLTNYPGNSAYTPPVSAVTWSQYQHDYLGDANTGNRAGGLLTLTNSQGSGIPVFLSPGNHDVSDAIGMSGKVTGASVDASSYVQIYNRMAPYSGKAPIATNVFSSPGNYTNLNLQVNYSFDIGGVHVLTVNMFPDKNVQQWMTADLTNVPASTPVLLFCHVPLNMAAGETKVFGNPASASSTAGADIPFALTGTDSTNSYVDMNAAKQSVADWLMTHPNVKALFSGHDNFNGTTNWNGQDANGNLIAGRDATWPGVTLFRVDSPMKGDYSGASAGVLPNVSAAGIGDETRLSFQVYSFDIASRTLTEREYQYNNTANPNTSGAWSVQSTTIDFRIGNYLMNAWRDQTNFLSTDKLLKACGNVSGASLTVPAVSSSSQQGGSVELNGSLITYLPPTGFIGTDSFTYVMTDSQTVTLQGTVTVTVTGSAASGLNIVGLTADANNVTVRLAGIPNLLYQVQASTNLIDWVNIGTTTAGGDGLFQFVDTNKNLYPTRYYRTRAN